MNNLKRVLSLALASVMLVGMMVVGASAANFTDADQIQHGEAVDILVALRVINGKEDGSYFDPTGNVTRAEMAKMIAVAMKGGNDVGTGTKSVPSFTDIAGHWAESYIEYCFDLGIISGRGDGTFDPNSNVTVAEVTKMALTALGYDTQAYGLTGASWATQTDTLARKADPRLFEDLDSNVVLNVPATRDVAAQIIWNGMQNETREYNPETNKSSGEITWGYNPSGVTMLKERYDADVYTGSFDGNYYTVGSSIEKGQIQVTKDDTYGTPSRQNTAKNSKAAANFPYDLDIANIGEEVKVIYKNGARSTNTAPDKNDTIYGVFVTGTTPVVNTTMDKVEGVDGKKVLKLDGTEYDLAKAVDVTVNYTGATTYKESDDSLGKDGFKANKDDSSAFTRLSALLGADGEKNNKYGKRGSAVKVVLNDSNEITKLYIVDSKLAVVSAVTSSKVTLQPSVGTINIADNDIYDGVKKNDVVVVTTLYKNKATDDDAYTIVKKADVVTGKVTAYKGTETISVDGTAYKINTRAQKPGFVVEATDVADVTFNGVTGAKDLDNLLDKNTEVNLYMVDGYVAGIEKVKENNDQYYVVTGVNSNGNTNDTFDALKIEVMGADGKKQILKLHEDSHNDVKDSDIKLGGDSDVTKNDINVGDLVTISAKSDGSYNVTVVATVAAGNWSYDEDLKSIKVGNKNYITSGDCVVFVQTDSAVKLADLTDEKQSKRNGGDYKAYTIRALKDMKNATSGTVYVDDGKVVAAFLDLGTKASSSGSDALFGIVTKEDGTTRVDGTNYFVYKVSAVGETYTVYMSKELKNVQNPEERSIVYFTPKADNIYDTNGDLIVVTSALQGAEIINANDTAVYGYLKEYDKSGNVISIYNDGDVVKKGDHEFEVKKVNDKKVDPATYAIDKDAKVYFVDADAKTTTADGSVTTWDSTNGYKNVIVVVDDKGKVQAIISEQGNEKALKG